MHPGMIAHTCNSSYPRGRDRRIKVQSKPGQKLSRPNLKNKLGVVVHTGNHKDAGGKDRRIVVQALPQAKNENLSEKLTKKPKGFGA
jgi:hypothetical protein